MEQTKALDEARRSPQGERGLKYKSDVEEMVAARRSPQGERGLKYRCSRGGSDFRRVAPRKGSVD